MKVSRKEGLSATLSSSGSIRHLSILARHGRSITEPDNHLTDWFLKWSFKWIKAADTCRYAFKNETRRASVLFFLHSAIYGAASPRNHIFFPQIKLSGFHPIITTLGFMPVWNFLQFENKRNAALKTPYRGFFFLCSRRQFILFCWADGAAPDFHFIFSWHLKVCLTVWQKLGELLREKRQWKLDKLGKSCL